MRVAPDPALVEALQSTLAAEHAAVHLYAVLGGQASRTDLAAQVALVTARHTVHRARRDDLEAAIARRGATPLAAAAAYRIPEGIETPEGGRLAALGLEQACTQAYAALVAGSADAVRGWAIDALSESAVAAVAWGGTPAAFPGAPEL